MRPEDVSSPELRALLQEQHRLYPDWGKAGQSFAPLFMPFYTELGCKSLLDYGCGKGMMREFLATYSPPVHDVRLYDPGVPEHSAMPEPADFVISISAMENVEPHLLPNVLQHLRTLTRKGLFLSITLTPGSPLAPRLPDGTIDHKSVHSAAEWLDKIGALPWQVVRYESNRKKLKVWICR